MPVIQFKRGPVANPPQAAAGEPLFTIDQNRLYIGDDSPVTNRLLGVLYAINKTSAPTAGDDAADGFSVGSLWLDTTADKAYVCVDSTAGAAIWKEISAGGGGGDGFITAVADTPTVDLTVSSATLSAAVLAEMSIDGAAALKLVNDAASPGASKLYGTDSAGAKGWQPQPTATSEGVWRYDATSTTMADPGAGKLRTNAAPGSATAIAISKTTDPGADVANFLRSLAQGDGVYIQDKSNSANWARYTLSAAPIDNTTWFQLPLTLVSSAGAAPTNNSPMAVVFSTAGGGGGGGGPSAGVTLLYSAPSAVGLPAVTTEQTLQSYTLPGGTLLSNGDSVRVRASGTYAAGASRTGRLYFGATQIAFFTVTAVGSWQMDIIVTRSGPATQHSQGVIIGAGVTATQGAFAPAETLSGPVLIKLTGQTGTALLNAVVCDVLIVELLTPAAPPVRDLVVGDTATVDLTLVGSTLTADVPDNAITNGKLRDSAGVSIIGRSANSTGDPADIVASADGQVLTRTAGALLFAAPPAAPLDIAGLTAADVALLDTFPIYDLSAAANRKATISHVGGLLSAVPGGRLTLVSGNPTGELDVGVTTGTVRYCPYLHNRIDLWDGTRWQSATFAELSVAFTTIANVDIFATLSGGAVALETATWSGITDRAPAVTLSLTDGRYTRTGNKTWLYLGTIRSGVAGGGVSDDERSRYVWNMYNRLPRLLKRKETATSWTWTSGSYHAANANSQNYVDVCRGLAEDPVFLTVQAYGLNSGAACVLGVGIGLDRNDGNDAYVMGGISPLASQGNQVYAMYSGKPGIGRRYFYWVEASGLETGSTTWFSTVGNGLINCGMFGYTWA